MTNIIIILVHSRQEADPWQFTHSLEEILVMEDERRPGPAKPNKAAL